MLKFLLVALWIFAANVYAAPTEKEMLAALNEGYATREASAMKVFDAWIAAGDPTSMALAQKYLTSLIISPASQSSVTVPSAVREKMIDRIIESKKAELYPAALATARETFNAKPIHTRIVQAVASAIPTNANLQKAVREGDPKLKLAPLVEKGAVQIRGNFDSVELAKALFAAQALPGAKVSYTGVTSFELNADRLDPMKLAEQAVAAVVKEPGMMSALMAFRATLSETSVPTRTEFTRELIRVIETADPYGSAQLAQAARNHMVQDRKDPFSNDTLRTLTVYRGDGADLELARFLHTRPVVAKMRVEPNAQVAGLRDVELIVYTGPEEKSVERPPGGGPRRLAARSANIPAVSYVYDVPGRQIMDHIKPENFYPGLVSYSEPKTTLWRIESAQTLGNTISPKLPSGSASAPDCEWATSGLDPATVAGTSVGK